MMTYLHEIAHWRRRDYIANAGLKVAKSGQIVLALNIEREGQFQERSLSDSAGLYTKTSLSTASSLHYSAQICFPLGVLLYTLRVIFVIDQNYF